MENLYLFSFLVLVLVSLLIFIFLLKKQNKSLKQKQYQNTEIDDFNIHYYDTANKNDVILLIHGIASSLFCWRFLIPLLEVKYRVIALDLPGFGQSSHLLNKDYRLDNQGNRVANFCKKLKVTPVHIVGCSMGGVISLWLKINFYKESKLSLLAPAIAPELVPIPSKALIPLKSLAPILAGPTLFKTIMRFIYYKPREELVSKESVSKYFSPYNNNPKAYYCLIQSLDLISDTSLLENLQPQKNSQILWGEKDRVVNKKYMLRLQKKIQSPLKTTLSGHHLMEENPEWTSENILSL
jgi:pimeloyl-ACP methyl ester carboxylesterase